MVEVEMEKMDSGYLKIHVKDTNVTVYVGEKETVILQSNEQLTKVTRTVVEYMRKVES